MKDAVLIKSYQSGITLLMREDASLEEILQELAVKFTEAKNFFGTSTMALSMEGREVTEVEEIRILDTIRKNSNVRIACIVGHDETTNKNFIKALQHMEKKLSTGDEGQFYKGTLKNREVIETENSIVVLGDVYPGSAVISAGNIIILGGLYGEAYAGGSGREDCYIVALEMEPERLKIGDFKYKTNAKQLKWGIHPKVQPKIAHLKNGKIVFDVVTSGKGGVGKTTTSANVGTGLAKAGSKVCLIDTDIGLRNLDVVMGLENRIVYNLVDVVEGNCRIKQALIRDKRHPGLYLMPSAQTRDKSAVTPGQMVKVIDHLREQFDYIILDCPAGIEQGFQNAIAGADRALVVTTPEVSAIRDADRIIGLLEANGFKQMDLIINRLRMDMVKRGDMMSADDVVDILAVPLIGIVPDDENVVIATNQGEPLVGSDTPAGKAYRNVVDRVLGKEIPFLDFEKGVSFWTKVTGIFRKA